MKVVLWDFDGVIMDSMKVRDYGFEKIFEDFSNANVQKLLKYHRDNGGLSRYVKIKYFFDEILKRQITEDQIRGYAHQFSLIMRKELISTKNLISDSVSFIKNNYKSYSFHVVSGSDQEELRFLCEELGLSPFFVSIHGSPTPKKELVRQILIQEKYTLSETCLIGDSINDYEAAMNNDIAFYAYNNEKLMRLKVRYINSFESFKF